MSYTKNGECNFGKILNASEKYCDTLTVDNAQVSPNETVKEGTVVTVTCLKPERYVLMGDKEVTCPASGEWSEEPECRRCGKVLIRDYPQYITLIGLNMIIS